MRQKRSLVFGALFLLCLAAGGCRDAGEGGFGASPSESGVVLASSQDADGYVYEVRDETVYAAGDVNIREAATSQSEIVAVLHDGESIRRVAYNYSWSKVIYEDRICYIASQYLTEK